MLPIPPLINVEFKEFEWKEFYVHLNEAIASDSPEARGK